MPKTDLLSINWRNDGITRDYIAENENLLERPESMPAHKLGEAVTYCENIYNPYAYEIMRRSGHLQKFMDAFSEKDRSQIFDRACRYHGMILM